MGLFDFLKPKKNWKILVVEDDVPLRTFIVERLFSFGVDVVETGDGLAVLDLIATQKPDCVLLDVMLPGKSGMQILEELRATDKKTPVVILTTLSGEGGLKLQAQKHNAIFLNKASTELEVIINTVLSYLNEQDRHE